MPSPARRGSGGHIFLPQYNYKATWKITIDNGTVYDVTNDILSLNISRKLSTLDSCQFNLSNSLGKYLTLFNGGEIVTVYAEYDDVANPTNKIFKGKLDNIYFSYGNDGYKATCECRQTPEVFDIKIVEQYDNMLISDAIIDIIDKYYTGILTHTNVNTSLNRVTTTYKHEAGIKAFADLAEKAEMDLYIDVDGDVHLITRGSVVNDVEVCSLENNILSVPKYGRDTTKIFNRIIAYGKEDNNIILLSTVDNVTSQTDLWVKEQVLTESKLGTMEETADKASTVLNNAINTEEDGRINVLGMIYINPGDYIYAEVPYCGIDSYQLLAGINHTFDTSGFLTTLEIYDKQDTLDTLFKERIDAEERLKPYSNLNNMKEAYTIFFTEAIPKWVLVNSEISDLNRLQLSSGQTSGTCTFNVVTYTENITKCELRIVVNYPGDTYSTYEASNDNGNTWETIVPGVVHTFNSTGTQLKYRINLISQDGLSPVYEMMCLLYK